MNVTPLALHSPRAIVEALRAGGWEPGQAATAAGGVLPTALRLTGLDRPVLEALVRYGGQLGLEVLTGDSWAILAGSRSRLRTLARPWMVPEPLAEVAVAVGLALPGEEPAGWRTARGLVPLDRPLLMGILNVTPDSFSDGGRFTGLDAALAHAERLLADGATILDVGGESTRPGRTGTVAADEELRRVLPIVEALGRRFPEALISVDTVKASVARAVLETGAAAINDVAGLRLDPALAGVVAEHGAGLVLMHSRGGITELASYDHASYDDLVREVIDELKGSLQAAVEAGVALEAIVVDPGFGFAKTVPQNLYVLDQLGAFHALGRPILVGPSRKRFLGAVTGRAVDDRDRATAVACALAYDRGARIFRVHDVAMAREALAVADAVAGGPLPVT